MGERRKATITLTSPDDVRPSWCRGWEAVKFVFGPWWFRWWLVLRYGGRHHHIYTGEPCVVFPAAAPKGGAK